MHILTKNGALSAHVSAKVPQNIFAGNLNVCWSL